MRAIRFTMGLLLVATSLAGCDDMNHQPRYDSYEKSSLFPDGKALQAPPPGTVARDERARDAALKTRPQMTLALIERGRERFGIYCTPCHDAAGYGNGVVPSRGFPKPPSLHELRLRMASPDYFVDVITNGHGLMYSYADRVEPSDRWAIAAYIEALQLSQHAPRDELAPQDLQKIEEASHVAQR